MDFTYMQIHHFLDRPDTLTSRFESVRKIAAMFQNHHKRPHQVIEYNHLGDIHHFLLGISLIGITNYVLTHSFLFLSVYLFLVVFASLCIINHYFNHATSYRVRIHESDVWLYRLCGVLQWIGILPTKEHHHRHHVAPHDCNFGFLVGPSILYEQLITSFDLPAIEAFVFYFCNPILVGVGYTFVACFCSFDRTLAT